MLRSWTDGCAQDLFRRRVDLIHRELGQAQEVDVARMRQTRHAPHLFMQHHVPLPQRSPARRGDPGLIPAEDIHDRGADRGRHVHRPGIV